MQRLSPRSIFVLGVDVIGKAIFPIAISLFARPRREDDDPSLMIFLFIGLGVAAIGVVGGLVSYFRTRFGVVGDELKVLKGGIWRQDRTIPLARIQNVLITQGLLERVLGIATVQVETASGSGAEAALKSLAMADAERLKLELLRVHARPAEEVASRPPVIYRPELKDILLAGALQNRAFIAVAAVLGIFGQGMDDLAKGLIDSFSKSEVASLAESDPVKGALVTGVLLLILILGGWILSVGYAMVAYYNFKVEQDDRGLHISYGLITRVQTIIPLRRIQILNTQASWLFRVFGLTQLYVQSVGTALTGQQNAAAGGGRALLAPICRPMTLRRLVNIINPRIDIQKVAFERAKPFFFWNAVLVAIPSLLPLFVPLYVLTRMPKFPIRAEWMFWAAGAIYGLVVWGSWLAYRRQAFGTDEEAIYVVSGQLGQNVSIVPFRSVQSTEIKAGWLKRKLGLVDVSVSTPVSVTNIPCMPRQSADALMDQIVHRSFRGGFRGL